jgi:lysine 2,3-aminomutase
MDDNVLERILQRVAGIPAVERIRIGTRTIVTMPMRITDKLAEILRSVRRPGRREIGVVTHVQHAYELTPDVLEAVERLRGRGIPVYNQLVYTFYVSRRFEAAALRRRLRLMGIDPYYTFNTKGKDETVAYRVPIARLLQEQKEEARLLPGLSRTDEAVFNVPGLGKNYLRAKQNRDLLSILPDGSRVYEFHPWEKNISETNQTYVAQDVPILEYLGRLEEHGESAEEYSTIWYYY